VVQKNTQGHVITRQDSGVPQVALLIIMTPVDPEKNRCLDAGKFTKTDQNGYIIMVNHRTKWWMGASIQP
jgi:hypothetical protein